MSVPLTPPPSATPACYQPIVLQDLLTIADWQERIDWQPFKPGVEIHRLYGDGITGPAAALLRYREAASVALHRHTGYEHILVLAGSQRDQNLTAVCGTLVVNPPGTVHRVASDAGCIVLAIYASPVEFLAEPGDPPAEDA